MSGARWTIRVCSGCQTDASQDCRCAPGSGSVDVPVEVMPVSERDRLREAAQTLVDLHVPIAEHDLKPEWARLRAVLDNTREGSDA